jgi:hypothetical protein
LLARFAAVSGSLDGLRFGFVAYRWVTFVVTFTFFTQIIAFNSPQEFTGCDKMSMQL